MSACWGPGVGGLRLGCGVGRPVRCSSALVMWLQLQPPGFRGTFLPLANWTLIIIVTTVTVITMGVKKIGIRSSNSNNEYKHWKKVKSVERDIAWLYYCDVNWRLHTLIKERKVPGWLWFQTQINQTVRPEFYHFVLQRCTCARR